MKIFFILTLFLSSAGFAQPLGWSDIEQQILGSNLQIQKSELDLKALEHQGKSGLSPFAPELAFIGGIGKKDTIELPEKGTQTYLRGRWNLFRGFRDIYTRKRLNLEEDRGRLRLEANRQLQLILAKELYREILGTSNVLEIFQRELEANSQQKAMAGKKVAAGLTSSVDNLEFELRENTIQIRIQKIQIEKTKKLNELRTLLNLQGDATLEVTGELSLPPREVTGSVANDSSLSKKYQLDQQISEVEKNEVSAEFWPEVNLEAQYGRLTLQENSPTRNDESNILLSISIPFFSGFDTYQKNKAQSYRSMSLIKEVELKKAEQRQRLIQLKLQLEQAWKLFDLNQASLKKISKYYDLTLSEYKRGVKNSPDLVSASERYFEMQLQHFELIAELNSIHTQFEKLSVGVIN